MCKKDFLIHPNDANKEAESKMYSCGKQRYWNQSSVKEFSNPAVTCRLMKKMATQTATHIGKFQAINLLLV